MRWMFVALITGLATGALYAAAALTYNVMFSTSKVLSVTTGHISMLGGIFGAWFISTLGWPIPLALLGSMVVGVGKKQAAAQLASLREAR